MAKNVLGIEFGSSRIKIAEMKGGSLSRFVTEDMPEHIVFNGEIVAWDALSDFLGEVMKKHHFNTKNVDVVVPDSLTYTRRLSVPLMTDAQLKVNLPYEFHDFISEDKDAYIYDYAIVGVEQDENGADVGLDVLAVAARKELIDRYCSLFRGLRMKAVMAAPQCLAYGALVRHLEPSLAEKDFIILDLGYSATRINIFSQGIFDTTRSIEIGCGTLVRRVADIVGCDEHIANLHLIQNTDGIMDSEGIRDICGDIAVDVMRAVNYYTYEKRDNNLETVYLCGGGALIPQLQAELRDSVPLNIVPLSDLADLAVEGNTLVNGPASVGICWNDQD